MDDAGFVTPETLNESFRVNLINPDFVINA